MSHQRQRDYMLWVKSKYPHFFVWKDVLDVWSMDVNGTNNYLFENCTFTGLDIGPGKNVTVVCPIKDYKPGKQFDVIISSEMLEHDKDYKASMLRMYELLKPGWFILVTCAWFGRAEHGTTKTSPRSSPYTTEYYSNIYSRDIPRRWEQKFSERSVSYYRTDLQFHWIKWGISS